MGASLLIPIGSSKRSARRHAALARKRGISAEKNRGNAAALAEWALPSPVLEARALVNFMRRNKYTLQQMLNWIGVSDKDYTELNQWAESHPTVAGRIESTMHFRHRVLQFFLILVELEEEATCKQGQ
jgi:hypothetical protein